MPDVPADTRSSYTSVRPDIQSQVPDDALRVLDVGCSNGALGAALRTRRPYRVVTGLEFSETFCAEARAMLDRVIQADIDVFDWDRQLSGETFDCIIFADVLEHLVEPWRVLREATRFLEPGGSIIVSLPNIRHVSALHSIFFRGTFPRVSRGIFDRTHLRWFTLSDARTMVLDAGLDIVCVTSHLRVRDMPGGRLNNLAQRHLARFARLACVREFFTYQFVIRATKA